MILVASIQHSGTHTLRAIVAGMDYRDRMRKPGQFNFAKEGDLLHAHFWDRDIGHIYEYAEKVPTVIPLRHPTTIALSWNARNKAHRADELRREWENLDKFDEKIIGSRVFYFPMETYPLDELEDFLEQPVCREVPKLGTKGPYHERRLWEDGQIVQLRRTKAKWALDFGNEILKTNRVARRFYAH